MNKFNIQVGQNIFLKPLRKREKSKELLDATVIKVARKYFWVDMFPAEKFHLDTLIQYSSAYLPDYRAYLTRLDFELEIEAVSLHDKILTSLKSMNKTNLDYQLIRRVATALGLE